jgi:hypothetical protein
MAKSLFRVQDLQARALESRGNPAAQTFRISQSIASWMSGLKIIGVFVIRGRCRCQHGGTRRCATTAI